MSTNLVSQTCLSLRDVAAVRFRSANGLKLLQSDSLLRNPVRRRTWRLDCTGPPSMVPVWRRLVASVLIVLAALPFTAPFRTCDVDVLLGQLVSPPDDGANEATRTPIVDPSSAAPLPVSRRQFRLPPFTRALPASSSANAPSALPGAPMVQSGPPHDSIPPPTFPSPLRL